MQLIRRHNSHDNSNLGVPRSDDGESFVEKAVAERVVEAVHLEYDQVLVAASPPYCMKSSPVRRNQGL